MSFNTGNPLPSKDILDLYDNSETIDNFVNSQQDEVPDRFGAKRLTLAGLIKRSMALRNEINDFSGALTFKPEWSDVPMNVSEGVGGEGGALNLQAEALGNRSTINKITSIEALRRTYQEVGLTLVPGSFEASGQIKTTMEVLLQESTGETYGWEGPLPKVVDVNSRPENSGGIGPGKWQLKTSSLLIELLKKNTGASLIGVGNWRTQADKNQDIVHIKDCGAVGDGITDDTIPITAAHVKANLTGATVSYSGIKRYAIQANAKIPVNTNVDFCGALCIILNGVVQTPTYSELNVAYLVKDETCDITRGTGTLTGSIGNQSRTPTKGIFDGEGVARIKVPYKIPNRSCDGVVDYEQTFNVVKDGECTLPLSVDLTGFENEISVDYRRSPSGRIYINSPALQAGLYNNQCFIKVERSKTTIMGFSVDLSSDNIKSSINRLIYGFWVAGLDVDLAEGAGQPLTNLDGTYTLSLDYCVDVKISNFRSIWRGWGSTVSYHCNGVEYINCDLTRIDIHAGGHNYTVKDCRLYDIGVVYGWGGGYLKVQNCSFYKCYAGVIETRPDFGGNWFGDITVVNPRIETNDSVAIRVATLNAGASIDTFLPKTIKLTGIHVGGIVKDFRSDVIIDISCGPKKSGTGRVFAPANLIIDTVTGNYPFTFNINLDYANMVSDPKVFRHFAKFNNILAGREPTKGRGIKFLSGSSKEVKTYVDISASKMILVEVDPGVGCVSTIGIEDSSVCGVTVLAVGEDIPLIRLVDCEYRYPAAGYDIAPIGTGTGAAERFTSISGGVVFAQPFDFSAVASCQGLNIIRGTKTPILPTGWTPEEMFTGKRLPGFF